MQPVLEDHKNLEEIVHIASKIGLEYVEAKKDFDRLELLKPTMRAKAMERYDDGQLSEAKLKRLAEMDDKYVAFLEKLSQARASSERLRIQYESYKNLFEAKRSLLSYKKAEMR